LASRRHGAPLLAIRCATSLSGLSHALLVCWFGAPEQPRRRPSTAVTAWRARRRRI